MNTRGNNKNENEQKIEHSIKNKSQQQKEWEKSDGCARARRWRGMDNMTVAEFRDTKNVCVTSPHKRHTQRTHPCRQTENKKGANSTCPLSFLGSKTLPAAARSHHRNRILLHSVRSPLHGDKVAEPLVRQLVRDHRAHALPLLARRLGLWARQGKQGKARQGKARQGKARQGAPSGLRRAF